MAYTRSATTSALEDHQTWIGYLQPDGLVVSPAALVDCQCVVDRSAAPIQERFLKHITEAVIPARPGAPTGDDGDDADGIPQPLIRDILGFLRGFLDWPTDLLEGAPVDDSPGPIAEHLKIPLREFGETLEPTFALRDFQPSNPERPWLLLVQELPLGVDLDAAVDSALSGWSASPSRRFERLIRETEVPIGVLTNRTHVRLVHAPRGENAGTLTFPVAAMTETAGRPIVAALEMLLCRQRLLSGPAEQRLPAILKKSRDYQVRVSTTLAQQVLDALYELLRGFQAADTASKGALLRETLEDDPHAIYRGLLTVLMRLVFLLYAEDRDLLPGSDLYVRNYALHGLFERLRSDAEQHPDTMDHRYGAWAQIITLCRAIYAGCDHDLLKMPAREGHLFDPDRYPFLEGRSPRSGDRLLPKGTLPLVPDGAIERVLGKLLILDGQRLSYRTLDVEQIGSVYETMMGFRLEQTPDITHTVPGGGNAGTSQSVPGCTLALRPAKPHGAPVPIDFAELLATPPKDRAKFIQDRTDYKLTATMQTAVKDAASVDDLIIALEKRIARNATPLPLPPGSLVLVPTDERRKTGSHYTPRSLTEPIVRKALEPILKQLGEHPEPEQILELKVCDPAMGSGAFLVEACRQLADQLVAAWAYHGYRPRISADEDELLYARRIIAQRCLYGVDKNPMATDLAKLSLWLATLAKDHPFTFLDHSLRTGDSLVGLTRTQIAHFNVDGSGEPTFVQGKLNEQMENALRARRQILAAGDDMPPANKAQKLALADEALDPVRLAGDLCVAAFFDGSKPKERKEKRDEYLGLLAAWKQKMDAGALAKIQVILKRLRGGRHPVTPFHWEIELPEVFGSVEIGFGCIVGNPPFLGGAKVWPTLGGSYADWLRAIHVNSGGKAVDLVAHFVRRAARLLRPNGCLGLIATNTIAEGDTRAAGLRELCTNGCTIYEASRGLKWPGQAAVIVSVVHICAGRTHWGFILDGREVRGINSLLLPAQEEFDAVRLAANAGRCFRGADTYGLGFIFSDDPKSGTAGSVSQMQHLIAANQSNAAVIFPYLGGDELLTHPAQEHRRYAINFGDRSLDEASEWPELLAIIEREVKPHRDTLGGYSVAERRRGCWWQYGTDTPALRSALRGAERALAISQTSTHMCFAFLPSRTVFSQKLIVVATHKQHNTFCVLQSRAHEIWVRVFASTQGRAPVYSPPECFETFPFPQDWDSEYHIEVAGRAYYAYRADLMVRNSQGLTATYNRFHDPAEGDADILKLRELHDAMDRAVLDAYGWTDIQPVCGFGLDYLDIEDEDMPPDLDVPEQLWWPTAAEALAFASRLPPSRKRLPWRYRWPEETRDEVLARLLELNKQRAEEERRSGLVAEKKEKGKKGATKRRGKSKKDAAGQLSLDAVGEGKGGPP